MPSNASTLELLGLPPASAIESSSIQEVYSRFIAQLQPTSDGAVVLSDPYFFNVSTAGILDSFEEWLSNLSASDNTRLLLLSILCRPFAPSAVSQQEEPRFIDNPLISLLFKAPSASLAERTVEVPFGLDVVTDRRRAFSDPALGHLIKALPLHSPIESITSELISSAPGIYDYQAWQVANWSDTWAVVYGISDAGHSCGYPFPWLFGFCRKEDVGLNFIKLLREAAKQFDWGFYSTYGIIKGRWRLALLALTVLDDWEGPRWDLLDELLSLDRSVLTGILDEGPADPKSFITRIETILRAADDAEIEQTSLEQLLSAAVTPTLAAVEAFLVERSS